MQARSMTRREIKAFREAGLDPFHTPVKAEDGPGAGLKRDSDAADWMAENIYHLPEDAPYDEILTLGRETFRLTYNIPAAAKVEEKNSNPPTAG